MHVFITHAAKDAVLARRLKDRLQEAGLTSWLEEDEIGPGDNWAKQIGEALESADAMIVLLSPGAAASDNVKRDVQYAIATPRFKDRLLTVFVGRRAADDRNIPWILFDLPCFQVDRDTDFSDVLDHLAAHVG